MNHKYLINTKEDFQLVLDYLEQAPIFAYDTETNGKFSRFEVQMVGMSFGFDLFSVYIPMTHIVGAQLEPTYVLDGVRPIFEDKKRKYVAHNAKFDEMVMRAHRVRCCGSGDDTYIMAWLLNENRSSSKSLKNLTKVHNRVQMQTYEDIIKSAPRKRGDKLDFNFARVPVEAALEYAADDAYYTLKLYQLFKPRLEAENLWSAYTKIERPISRVVGALEWQGVNIDRELLKHADTKLPSIAEEIEAQIYEEADEVFKISSRKQLGHILYEKLGIGNNVPRTKTGLYSTNKKTLKTYAGQHPIVDKILRRKKIEKTHSTFVEGFKTFVEKDGKVHPSFNPCGTVTGRFAGNKPNLQQIEGDEVESIKIRDFFIPSPGCRFVVSDYSQIELRVIAHLSKDENMINAFLSGRDFHEETARIMYKMQGIVLAPDQPVPARGRFNAKALNFGIPYGRGEQSVGEQLKVTARCKYWSHIKETNGVKVTNPNTGKFVWIGEGVLLKEPCHNCGKCFIVDWFAGYQDVLAFRDKTWKEAEVRGYIRTLAGRKRRLLPEIRSSSNFYKSGAQRQAFNTKIQGSAADIIKLAMVNMKGPLRKEGAHIILQIHDELVVESPADKCDTVAEIMKEIMENPLDGKNPLRLPLVTQPTIVDKWGDAK